MKPAVLYRIASVLLLVAAAGNALVLTFFWRIVDSVSSGRFPGDAARAIMGNQVFGALGVVFGAYVAWRLSALARTAPQAIGALGWVLLSYQLAGVYIAFTFHFGLVQKVPAVLVALCTGWASWLSARPNEKGRHSEPALG